MPPRLVLRALPVAVGLLATEVDAAAANAPSGPHPRLFFKGAVADGLRARAAIPKTAGAGIIAQCKDAISTPKDYATRGGSDGNNWPGTAFNCAFAYLVNGDTSFLDTSIKYW